MNIKWIYESAIKLGDLSYKHVIIKLECMRITLECVDRVFDIIAQAFGENSKKKKLGVGQENHFLKESY